MKKKKRILVLTDDMPWGHRSIAKAIYEFLKKREENENYKVEYAQVKSKLTFTNHLYTFFYRYLPKLWKFSDDFSKTRLARRIYHNVFNCNLPNLKKVVLKSDPDLIISTFFGHSQALVNWKKNNNKNFLLWTILADPWTSSPITFVNGCDLHLVYDQIAKNLLVKDGINKNKILITGWWVRQQMYKKYNRAEARKKIGINDNRTVIFVGGGSLGNNSLPKILPLLDSIKGKVGLIFNSGTDKLAFELVEKNIKNLNRKNRGGNKIIIRNFGWIENMAEILSACNIVFGKAGPNFLFDCIACQKPFVAVTHIAGQEDGNINLIKEKELGWVREKNGEMEDFLSKYLDNPTYFEKMYLKNIKAEAARNKRTMPIILNKIKKDLKI
jgi:UDP-N-acetylglucosamine:LPS N-acetylglucosamine transferase